MSKTPPVSAYPEISLAALRLRLGSRRAGLVHASGHLDSIALADEIASLQAEVHARENAASTGGERQFNGLTSGEHERLTILMEECGEVVQVIGKILRHGLNSASPSGGPSNRESLTTELADISVARALLVSAGDLSATELELAAVGKAQKIHRYLHHQPPAVLTGMVEIVAPRNPTS